MPTSESGRFYDKTGRLCDTVVTADGKSTRKANLGDAKKHGWLPSFSTVSTVLSSYNLERYKIRKAIEAANASQISELEALDDYCARIGRASGQHAALAADRGKEIHGQVDEFFTKDIPCRDPAAERATGAVRTWLEERYGDKYALVCEDSFANARLGWAGTCDMRVAPELEGVPPVVMDFKTTTLAKLRAPYFKWGVQLACYRMGIELPDNTELVSVPIDKESGDTQFHEWNEKAQYSRIDLERAWSAMFALWCIQARYYPGERER